jgi:hypothetical protein
MTTVADRPIRSLLLLKPRRGAGLCNGVGPARNDSRRAPHTDSLHFCRRRRTRRTACTHKPTWRGISVRSTSRTHSTASPGASEIAGGSVLLCVPNLTELTP